MILIEEVRVNDVFDQVVDQLDSMTDKMFDKYTLNRWYESIDNDTDESFDDVNASKDEAISYFKDWVLSDKDGKVSEFIEDLVGFDPDNEIDYEDLIGQLASEWEFDNDTSDENNFSSYVAFVKDEYMQSDDNNSMYPWEDEYERGYARRDM